MRTTIEIIKLLIRRVMRARRTSNWQAAAEADLLQQRAIRRLRGKVQWEGDLNEMRLSRDRASR